MKRNWVSYAAIAISLAALAQNTCLDRPSRDDKQMLRIEPITYYCVHLDGGIEVMMGGTPERCDRRRHE